MKGRSPGVDRVNLTLKSDKSVDLVVAICLNITEVGLECQDLSLDLLNLLIVFGVIVIVGVVKLVGLLAKEVMSVLADVGSSSDSCDASEEEAFH